MKRKLLRFLFSCLAIISFFDINTASAIEFPALNGRIYGEVGIINYDTKSQIISKLKDLEDKTHIQFVVAIFKSLHGNNIEEFGYQLGRKWGIGQKDINNGVILIIAKDEHSIRIEVGYGLEGRLTDAISSQIINEKMVPSFKGGDYQAGINAAVDSIINIIDNPSSASNINNFDNNSKPNNKLFAKIIPYFGFTFFGFISIAMLGGGYFARKFLSKYKQNLVSYADDCNVLLSFIIYALLAIISAMAAINPKKYRDNSVTDIKFGSKNDNDDFSGGGGSFGGGGASSKW